MGRLFRNMDHEPTDEPATRRTSNTSVIAGVLGSLFVVGIVLVASSSHVAQPNTGTELDTTELMFDSPTPTELRAVNFCSEWCNEANIWGCGVGTMVAADGRNTGNTDYSCDCAGCNGCPTRTTQCVDGLFSSAVNFCSEWCNSEKWGCGVGTMVAADGRNTGNTDYSCDCAGCNGCPTRTPQCVDGLFSP